MSGSSVTPPKGRATRARNDTPGGRAFFTPAMQWALVVLAVAVVIGLIWYLGRDVRSDITGQGVQVGAAVARFAHNAVAT